MRTFFKIPIYFLAVIILIIVAAAYLYYFTTLPESELNGWVNSLVPGDGEIVVNVERINRDIWRQFAMEGVSISSRTDRGSPEIRINKIQLKYDAIKLLKDRSSFDLLKIDSIEIFIPEPKPGNSETGEENNLSIPVKANVDLVEIGNVSINVFNKDEIFIDSLILSTSVIEDEMKVDIMAFSADIISRNTKIQSLNGSLTSSENGYLIDSLYIVTDKSRIYIEGSTGPKIIEDMKIAFECNKINLEDIRNLTGVKINGLLESKGIIEGAIDDFKGQAFVDGEFFERDFDNVNLAFRFYDKKLEFSSIVGNIFYAAFDGSGILDFGTSPETYVYHGTIENLDLRNIGPDLYSDFTGHVHLDGQSLGRELLMEIDCDIHSTRIDEYYFDEVSGPFKLDLEKIEFLDGFNGRYKNTYIDAAGYLEYDGSIDLNGDVRFDDLTDFTGQTFLKELRGRGEAQFHATSSSTDFDVTADFISDSCWTYGLEPESLFIHADLKTFVSHRVGKVSGSWLRGEVYSVPVDSGYFETTVSGDRVFFDSAYVSGLDGGLTMYGDYDGTRLPPVFKIDTLWADIYGNRIYSQQPAIFHIYERETDINKFNLGYGQGELNLSGIVTNELDLDLNIDVVGIDIEPIMSQVYPERNFNGTFSSKSYMSGNFEYPIIDFQLSLDSIYVDYLNIGNLDVAGNYNDGYLFTDQGKFFSEYGSYDFAGRIPIDLRFTEVENRFPDDSIDFTVTSQNKRQLLAEAFITSVERFDTDENLTVRLSGTYDKPIVTGTGTITNGTLKAIDLVTPFTDVSAEISMENEIIHLVSAYATVEVIENELEKVVGDLLSGLSDNRQPPEVRASGDIALHGINDFYYDLDLQGSDLYFFTDQFNMQGIADLDLAVEGPTPPTVNGKIYIKELDIREEFESFIDPEYDPTDAALEDSTIWNLDLEVIADNNIWIKNSEVDGEFKADLQVRRELGIYYVLGTLDVIRGSYNLLGQKFRIVSGQMIYQDVTRVDPDIDFIVTTRVKSTSESGSGAPLNLELHITGTLLEPEINAGPNSTLSREDIFRLLFAGGWVPRGGSGAVVGSASAVISSFGIDPFTAQGILEEFEISNDPEDDKARLNLAKYISKNLYVRYSRRLSVENPGSLIGVEYYFNDNIFFQASQGTQSSGYEGISFDLNINYEF